MMEQKKTEASSTKSVDKTGTNNPFSRAGDRIRKPKRKRRTDRRILVKMASSALAAVGDFDMPLSDQRAALKLALRMLRRR